MNTVDLFSKKQDCCGCSMCAYTCPVGIISMVCDEQGFLYPCISDNSKCINCKQCLSVCPLKAKKSESEFTAYYAGSLKEKDDLVTCSSGGIATAMARGFVNTGGVVYGAAYSSDWKTVEYIRCDTPEAIERLKTSKYSQAEKGNIYEKLKDDLHSGKKCLFIGLPCDVAAVCDKFKGNENLFTAELICHGPTSNKVNEEYCEYLKNRFNSEITSFSTRYKKDGMWKPFYIHASFENGKEFLNDFHESEYGAAFRYLKRPSCYECKIKGDALKGDVMLGDYHYVEEGMDGYNPSGVSSVLVHTEKGEQLLEMCEKTVVTSIEKRGALANRAIFNAIEKPEKAEAFARVFVKDGLIKAGRLGFVKTSNTKRKVKANILRIGVSVKRFVMPSTRPGK